MLESIRKHQKLLQGILLFLIFPSFAFFGIESYMRSMGSDADLVKVAGSKITRQELDNAVKAKADNLQKQRGSIDSAMVNSAPFKQSVLGELVQQRLVAYELNSLKLSVSNEALSQDLLKIPEIRSLYAEGKFDSQRYKQLLANNGMTIDQFENGRRYDIMSKQALLSVMATGIGSRKVAGRISEAFETEREVQTIRFVPTDFLSKVSPTEKELESYYQSNMTAYQAPESIDVEYIYLAANAKDDSKQFAERADLLANISYEQPDSLKPAADRLKLNIQTVKGISRGGAKSLPADHPLNNPKVIAAVFSEDAIKNRRNIEAQEIAPGKLVVARVINHQAQAAIPLATVLSEVKKQVSLRLAEDLANKVGKEKLELVQKNPTDASGFGAAKWVSRNKPVDMSPQAMGAVMSIDADKLPAIVSAPANEGGLVIYRVTKIQQPKNSDSKMRMNQAQQIAQMATQAEAAGYFDSVRERAGVKVLHQVK
jgi:hypothetical protein